MKPDTWNICGDFLDPLASLLNSSLDSQDELYCDPEVGTAVEGSRFVCSGIPYARLEAALLDAERAAIWLEINASVDVADRLRHAVEQIQRFGHPFDPQGAYEAADAIVRHVRYLRGLSDVLGQRDEGSAQDEPKTPGPETAADKRNAWIYAECRKGTPYCEIRLKLKTKPVAWERIESDQGIKDAGRRYAEKNNLPPPPSRQSGRPTKRKTKH